MKRPLLIPENIQIETTNSKNIPYLVEMALDLWPHSSNQEEYNYFKTLIGSKNATCFLAKSDKQYFAFIHLTLRHDYVEGTNTSPVAYIEGIYVKPDYRGYGIGKRLVQLGEVWGLEHNCSEYASDVEFPNKKSITFHKKAGFQEVNRVVNFYKKII